MEQNKEQYYSNYKCYWKNGNRFAIFGKEIDGILEVFGIMCSRKDNFKKQIAREVYSKWLEHRDLRVINSMGFHPFILNPPKKDEDSSLFTFNQYCKENFYHKTTITCLYNTEILKKGNEVKVLNAIKKKVKI